MQSLYFLLWGGIKMLGPRLKELRTKKSLTLKALGRKINVAESTLSLYENGKREPDYETITKFADFFNVTLDYLLGKSSIPNPVDAHSPEKRIPIPKYNGIKAGFGGVTLENFEEYEYFDISSINGALVQDYFCTTVKGDSMAPELKEDDIILVRKQTDVDSGKIAVVVINSNEATVKKIKKGRDYVELMPYNPAHNSVIIEGDELQDFHIVGQVMEIKRKLW